MTQAGCTSTGNAAFAVSGTNLNIGGAQINDTTARSICIRARLAGATDFFNSFTLTGSGGASTQCTPAGSPCPVGATAPAGFHFNLVAADDFTHDTDFNLSLWDCSGCLTTYPGQFYFNSNGLNIDSIVSDPNCDTSTHNPGCQSGVGSADAITQKYGYWEWYVKHPSDVNGEGDGYHIDTYQNDNKSSDRINYSEVDLDETVLGTGNQTTFQWTCCATPTSGSSAIFDTGVVLGAGFHIYGTMWVNDGSASGGDNGTSYGFFDGSPVWGPLPFSPTNDWGTGGATIIMGSIRNCLSPDQIFAGGNPCGPNTVAHGNPYVVSYFRLWQIVPN